MPVYEYRCAQCEHAWSDLVSASSTAMPDCPACRSPRVEKLFSVFASSVASPGGDACATAPRPACGPGTCGCGRFT